LIHLYKANYLRAFLASLILLIKFGDGGGACGCAKLYVLGKTLNIFRSLFWLAEDMRPPKSLARLVPLPGHFLHVLHEYGRSLPALQSSQAFLQSLGLTSVPPPKPLYMGSLVSLVSDSTGSALVYRPFGLA
tara:strand:- start:563 stop:958 length:396 start_codon:yes stop_codon:yes gene_type:complete